MPKTYTAAQLAIVKHREAFDLHFDYGTAVVTFQNGIHPVSAPFSVTFDDGGVTITVHSEEHGPFDILSPQYNNLYMHNLNSVSFII